MRRFKSFCSYMNEPNIRWTDSRTAKQIHRDDMKHWSYAWRYCLGWPKNQIQILWLRWKNHA